MNPIDQRICIRIVAIGLRKRLGRDRITSELRALGLPDALVEENYLAVEAGLKSGVNAAVTGGLSANAYKRGESALFDAAFDEGYSAFRRQVRLSWLRKLAILLAGVAVIIAAILHLTRR